MQAEDELEQGRASWADGAWLTAYEHLSRADRLAPLEPADVELLATAAYMLGRDDEYVGHLERAHRTQLDAGDVRQAARSAFWLGMELMVNGEIGRGTGWLGRAQRLAERLADDCVEHGYLLLPLAFQREAAGELEAAAATAADAVAVAERCGDDDLFALAVHMQGHLLVNAGQTEMGLGLLDEAMVAVTTGALSPIVSGLVYCGVIMGCQAAYEPRRAQEWTAALSRWCERQPEMVAFSGRCHVHRAEIMQLHGAWSDALEEARCAARRAIRGNHRRALGEAAYVQGEVLRLRGEFSPAQESFREAAGYGRDPQPGLALLRLAQGEVDAAAAAIRRILGETTRPDVRAQMLPAHVEIMLAAGDVAAARAACDELARIAAGHESELLGAISAQALGAVELAEGDAGAALPLLREAWRAWEDVEAPYEAARARMSLGATCRALGDEEAAALEFEAARRAFVQLGAKTDLARIEALRGGGDRDGAARTPEDHGLSARELEVLRLVAAGATNRAIADELVLSVRTVERHVSNIFAKLRVGTRAAAAAYAHRHALM